MEIRAVSTVVLILLLCFLALFFIADSAEVEAVKDKTPSVGSIVINNGDLYTTSMSVTLTLTAYDPESGVKEVRYSNNGVWDKSWERFSETKSWTLTSGDGEKTVYYQIRNNDNVISVTYSDTIILNTQPTTTPEPTPYPTPQPTTSPTPMPTATPQPTSSPTPQPTSTTEPTSEPAITPSPTPLLEPSETAAPLPKVALQSTSLPENLSTPTASPKSGFDPIFTETSQNEVGKPIAASVVTVCGCVLLFFSLHRKR